MIDVKISADGMMAEVSVTPEPEEELTEELIINTLKLEGVQVGIDNAAVSSILKNKDFGRFVPVANGKKPVNGRDGYYEYYFLMDDGKPKVRADGSVDYAMTIANVNQGDVIARYYPETGGNFGYNVYAKTLAPVRGKPARKLTCKNVRREDNCFYAEQSGRASLDDTTIAVYSVLEINGDADFSFGDIDFKGDVSVSGNISGGITVHAEGSIKVDGVIESAKVYAKRNITVQRGIHGQGTRRDEAGSTVVEAGGNLKAVFIDHAFVRAGGDIFIDYSVGSLIGAEGKVIASGVKGAIIGGNTYAHLGIEANIIGNPAQMMTEIRTGSNKELKREAYLAKQELQSIEEKNSNTLNNTAATDDAGDAEEIARNRLHKAERLLRQSQAASVIVHKMIYENSHIAFDEMQIPDQTGKYGVEYRKINGQVLCKAIGHYTKEELTIAPVEEAQTEVRKKSKVLLIDDDPRFLRTIQSMLKAHYQIAMTTSGKIARKYLENNMPELILLDYMMPEENGVDVLKSLRAWKRTQDIPVIFLTGLDDKRKIMECLSLHPAGYITKPVSEDSLLTKIHSVMGDI